MQFLRIINDSVYAQCYYSCCCLLALLQHEINQFAISSFVPLEQSYFNTPNLAGAIAIVETGIADDDDKRKKELREMGHRSKKCECLQHLLL